LTSKDSTDIRINNCDISFKRKREHRPSGVRTEPRQREERVEVVGNHSPMFGDNSNCSTMKIHRTTVVTKARPFSHDIANRRLSASCSRWESFKKLMPTRNDSRHLRLLEHQFRNEYRPWVAGLSPRQLVTSTSGPSKYRLDVRRSEHESVF